MSTPREQLAEVLKRSRVEAGFASHGALAKRLNVSRPVISRAESATQAVPSDALLAAWSGATGVPLNQLTDLAQRCKSGTPDWFVPYLTAESQADSLRCWSPLLIPGLLQPESYARAVLSVESYAPDRLAELVTARIDRQQVLGRAHLTAVIDAHVLQRCIGSPAIMAEACGHLVMLAARPNVSFHVSAEGTNVGLWGAFDVAARDSVFTVRFETMEDVTGRAPETISKALLAWERILGAALPRADSLDYAREMESQWKTRS